MKEPNVLFEIFKVAFLFFLALGALLLLAYVVFAGVAWMAVYLNGAMEAYITYLTLGGRP